MKRDRAGFALLFAAAAWCAPARADNMMQQSPLLMRRAGPSCQPGNLGGSPGAGYGLALGPCAGADPSTPPVEGPGPPRHRRR